jgi:hypothetical protein
MKTATFSLVTALAFLALTHTSFAQAREGLYVRGEVGRSDVDERNIKDSSSLTGLDVGWRFTDNFGAELGFRDLGSFSGTLAIPTVLNADALTVALSGRSDFHPDAVQGFYLEGRFGLANFDVKGKEIFGSAARTFKTTGSRSFFSVGAGYDMTEDFSMAVNYSRYQAQGIFSGTVGGVSRTLDVDFPALSIVAEFRFN